MSVTTISTARPRAEAALRSSPVYELRDLQVEPCDGALRVSGRVSSFYHKQLAQEVVRSVCKGIEVINTICVVCEGDVA